MSHHSSASANPNDFILPDLGEGVHEAELLKWRVKVGDSVKEHDILADMETDKAVVEVPSPRTGVIAALHGSEGEILKVGNALVSFVASAGASPATPVAEPKPASAAPCDMGAQIASHAPAENGT
ncbi:MAG: biotin/lipoyl-containing protein, partial [Phycisphaerales bacterium]